MTDSLNPPYTIDKLRKTTEEEVNAEINSQLREFGTSTIGGSDKAVYALNAQILMHEVARRAQEEARRVQDRQARIMIRCTILIAFMTLVLVCFTWLSLFAASPKPPGTPAGAPSPAAATWVVAPGPYFAARRRALLRAWWWLSKAA